MAITFTAGTSTESTGSVTSTTVTLPSGLASGDYTIIVVSLNVSSGAITTPSGWTNILASTASVNGSTADKLAIFYRKWVSGDASTVAVATASGRVAATPIKVSGADGTTFVDTAASVNQNASPTATVTAPSITPSSDTLVCVFNGRDASNGNFQTPYSNLSASMTEIAEASGKATNATNAGHCIAYEVVTPGAATGTRSADPAQAADGSMGVSFSLNAASTGTTLSPSGIASAEALGSPTVTATLTASPSGVASAEAFGTVTRGPVQPTGIASAQAIGAAVVSLLLTVSPTGIGTAEAFGTPTATATLTASPTVITTAEAFGTLTATKTLTASPTGIGSGEALGTPSVTTAGSVAPTGIGSAQAFGAPVVSGLLTVNPTAVGISEAFGTPTASVPITAAPSGIGSGEAFGTPSVTTSGVVSPNGIASAETFGAVTAIRPVTAQPTGIGTAELVNNVVVSLPYTVTLVGIGSAQAMGTPSSTNILTVQPVTLGDMAQYGNPTAGGLLTVGPTGIGTGYGPGFPTVTQAALIQPVGIPSAGFVELPRVIYGTDTSRNLVLSFVLLERPLSASAISQPWLVAEISHPIIGGTIIPGWTFEAAERHITVQLLEGDMADRIIQKSTGAVEYVGGTITEDTGRDISAATVRLSLGSATDAGAWVAPAQDTSGPLNVRKVTMLVGAGSANTPKGEYWVWAKVIDTSETTILRLPQKVVVR